MKREKLMFERENELSIANIGKIIETAKTDPLMVNFGYYKDFFDKWHKYLRDTISSLKAYSVPKLADNDQCFIYTFSFGNQNIDFHFSIKYLRGFILYCKTHNKRIIKIDLSYKNGELIHNNFKCQFDRSATDFKPSSAYNDLDDIIIIPMLIDEYAFLVVDGNHRVNCLISENKKIITVTYLDYIVAARSMATSIEIALYCFLEDFQKIRNNLYKIDHGSIYKALHINNHSKTLNIIKERNNEIQP